MLHKAVSLYLWLSYRFAGVFQSQAVAFTLKDLVEAKINDNLSRVDYDAARRKRLLAMRQQEFERSGLAQKAASTPLDSAPETLELN